MKNLWEQVRLPWACGLVLLNLQGCGSTPAFEDRTRVLDPPAADSTTGNGDAIGGADSGNATGGSTNGNGNGSGKDGPLCASEATLVRSAQTVTLNWGPALIAANAQPSLENLTSGYTGSLGQVSVAADGVLRYTAPAHIATSADIAIKLSDSSDFRCLVRMLPDGGIGVPDDGVTRGLVGHVYLLPEDTSNLPNFGQMTSIGEIVTPDLNVPNRSFTFGFPGVDANLIEWFGLRFDGQLTIATAGTYEFRLTSDDGARLYIDDTLVVDNDGKHAVQSREGVYTMTAGKHRLRVDYYQGPRYYIALQLFWRPAGSGADFTIVPADVLSRPATSP